MNIHTHRTKLAAAAGTLAVGAALALAGSANAAVEYKLTITDPGPLDANSPFQQAPWLSINNLGTPVGSTFSTLNDGQGTFATRGTGLEKLTIGNDVKNRNHQTVAFDINDGGTAVGTAQQDTLDTELGLGPERPYLWSAGVSTGTPLNIFAGKSAQPQAINNGGDIVGESFPGNGVDGKEFKTTAFELTRTGTLLELPTLPGGRFAKAADIDETGTTIVGSSDLSTNINVQHATAWRNGVASDLGTLPGGTFSAAVKVNASGTAVGVSNGTSTGNTATIFAGGQVTSLGAGSPSKASSVNDGGTVVGWSGTNDGNASGFRFKNGKLENLNTLIAPGSGYTLGVTNSVNNAGQIVGVARENAHPSHMVGFILTPIS